MKQTMKLPKSGSFFNYLMANNESIPVEGEYATFLHYTDRTVALIREVSDDGKKVVLERCTTVADGENLPMGHQCWKHTPNGQTFTLVWYRNGWRIASERVAFEPEFAEKIPAMSISLWLRKNDPDLFEQVYAGNVLPTNVIPGVTKRKKVYDAPIRVLFGACEYYYDWEF